MSVWVLGVWVCRCLCEGVVNLGLGDAQVYPPIFAGANLRVLAK